MHSLTTSLPPGPLTTSAMDLQEGPPPCTDTQAPHSQLDAMLPQSAGLHQEAQGGRKVGLQHERLAATDLCGAIREVGIVWGCWEVFNAARLNRVPGASWEDSTVGASHLPPCQAGLGVPSDRHP